MKLIFNQADDDWEELKGLNKAINGKVVEAITDEIDLGSFLTIIFTDKTALKIKYDWIYSVQLFDMTDNEHN